MSPSVSRRTGLEHQATVLYTGIDNIPGYSKLPKIKCRTTTSEQRTNGRVERTDNPDAQDRGPFRQRSNRIQRDGRRVYDNGHIEDHLNDEDSRN